MKVLHIIFVLIFFLTGCKNDSSKKHLEEESGNQNTEHQTDKNSSLKEPLDWSKIPLAKEDIGAFPYFNPPKGYEYSYKEGQNSFTNADLEFSQLEFYINGAFQKFEGEVFKSKMKMSRKNGKRVGWIEIGFKKAYEHYIESVGGVKLFEGIVPKEAYDKLANPNEQYPLQYVIGGEEVSRTPISIYAIQTPDDKILVQTWANSAGGRFGVLRIADFEQTITKVTASEIKESLDKNGFIALQINFEFGKARIKPDSYYIIKEIKKLLEENKGLRISIDGHTDNIGKPEDNLKLSNRRAQSVSLALIDEGIDENRMEHKGFGDTKPTNTNDTEEGRSKNRRVEIRKL